MVGNRLRGCRPGAKKRSWTSLRIPGSVSQCLETIQISGDEQRQFFFNTGAGLGMEPIFMDLLLTVKAELDGGGRV